MPAPAGPRGPYRKGIQRRQEIIAAAAQIFARYGYHGGSLRQIAGEVGISAATLVSHFEHKEGLLVAVLEHWKSESAQTKAGAEGVDFFLRLPRLMEYHVQNRGMLELFLTLSTEATDPEHPAWPFIQAQQEKTLNRFSRQLTALQKDCDVHPFNAAGVEEEIRGLIALMDGLELQWLLNAQMDLVRVFTRQLLHLLSRWSGLSEPDLIARYQQESLRLSA